MSKLDETMQRAHEAWEARWQDERADVPVYRYQVKLDCGRRAFAEAVGMVACAPVDMRRAVFDKGGKPSAIIEFDCRYELWAQLRKQLLAVPADGRWVHQEELKGSFR